LEKQKLKKIDVKFGDIWRNFQICPQFFSIFVKQKPTKSRKRFLKNRFAVSAPGGGTR
jgi:hypothetical protein